MSGGGGSSGRKFRLLPTVRVAKLAGRPYVYDEGGKTATLVYVPTQRIPERAYEVIRRLQAANPLNEPRSLEQLLGIFEDPGDRSAVDVLRRRGYLEEWSPPPPQADRESGGEGEPVAPTGPLREAYRQAIGFFVEKNLRHFFHRPRLFHLPEQIEDATVDVGFVGVPFASRPVSAGTVVAPACLRASRGDSDFWFQVHDKGFATEVGLGGELPPILCRGVQLKDYGDLGAGVRTVADLFAQLRHFVDEVVVPNRFAPLFFGGDHAITFPIVDSLLKHHPDLCLIHLDAHNDLFYCDHVTYNHAATVSNLILYSDLPEVFSLGLRTNYEMRTANVGRVAGDPRIAERLHLHSIGSMKRALAEPARFQGILEQIGGERPCYLTIDLDVLSPGELENQVSTPCGTGLAWWELLEAVSRILRQVRVVAADVVEYNPLHRDRAGTGGDNLTVLLLLLIDGLARARREHRAAAS